ncbi:MAG: hypothetical protein IV103_18065 [Zoogloea sp.]|nr:hypothetical protein [Zoogloea sp.]
MTALRHIVEPERLLLTWQPVDEKNPMRTRRLVGVVVRRINGQFGFRYTSELDDYKAAVAAGFQGFPAFKQQETEITQGVLEALLRRLPPRKREDFPQYLASHKLPSPFPASDFALLGYTRARLPSDGFELVPVFSPDVVPCDLFIELAGTRHVDADLSAVALGDTVTFEVDPENPVDQDSILALHQGRRLGYINRALKEVFHQWLGRWDVRGTVERLNGKPERPLVFIRVEVRALP